MQNLSRTLFFLLLAAALPLCTMAQNDRPDSTRLTLRQTDGLFLKNNLQLILKQFDVENAQAEVITARLFDNPQFNFENAFYNPDTRKVFDMSYAGGQYQAQVAQLFRLAGKRNKNIRLAEAGALLPEYAFGDLLRTLRYQLHTDFFKISFQQRSISVYDKEISSLKDILRVFEQQYERGNVAEKEVLRIRSELYTLEGEQSELYNGLEDLQTDFRQLTSSKPSVYLVPLVDTARLENLSILAVPYTALLDSAVQNRNDLKIAKQEVTYAALNLKLQKANAVPDLTVSATYDKQGSFTRNYNGLGVGLPIPLFNRNQGLIKQARIAEDAATMASKGQELSIENDLTGTYRTALMIEKYYRGIDPRFEGDFTHLIDEVNLNYQKRNISLLEFLDFYDSYKTNAIQINNLKFSKLASLEEINYVTETPFF